MQPQPIQTFGDYRLDPVAGHLYKGDRTVALPPKAFALLQYLVSSAGRLVPKQELLEAVWPDVFVGDAVLKVTIRELRRAFGDDSHAPRFIETAHRRGYRFIATAQAAAEARTTPKVSCHLTGTSHDPGWGRAGRRPGGELDRNPTAEPGAPPARHVLTGVTENGRERSRRNRPRPGSEDHVSRSAARSAARPPMCVVEGPLFCLPFSRSPVEQPVAPRPGISSHPRRVLAQVP